MLLGIKSKKVLFARHLFVAGFGGLLTYIFYKSYPQWGIDHALWRSFAHTAFVFLFLSLILGPAAKLWRPFNRFISWRREFGFWFAIFALIHGYIIWTRWATGDVMRLFGFEYFDQLSGYVLFRSEVGIMNMMGLMVLPMIIVLAITSSDRAVSFLGISSWKWLHSSLAHVIFYVLVLRGILYFFFFFELTYPRMAQYPSVWFLYPFIGMALLVVLLQAAAFIKTVFRQRGIGQEGTSMFQKIGVLGVGLLFVLSIALPGGMVIYLESRSVDTTGTASAQLPSSSAKSFYMVVKDGNQEIHLWARNLDREAYFRETVIAGGSTISHQIYRFDERAMYSAKLDESGQMAWSKSENMEPGSVGISGISAGPGAWAAQYGKGEHQINFNNKMLPVSILSVNEAINDEIFKLPNFTNSASPAQ